MRWAGVASCLVFLCAVAVFIGCATTGEQATRDPLTAQVGVYPAPPAGTERVRVGVPPFSVEQPRGRFGFGTAQLNGMAADQLTTLLHQTARFNVIERAQLTQLLVEQDLEGIVRAGELAKPAQVRGVDYLLLGKITGFRVTTEQRGRQAGLRGGWLARQTGGITGGVEQQETVITAEMGVDLRLVEPSTGEIKSAQFSQFRQQNTARSFGIDVAGAGVGADGDVQINEDDAGRLMRMAFDDTVRKMLPEIDQRVLVRASAVTPAAAPAAAPGTTPATAAFCSQCGAKLAAASRFCGECGAQTQ